MQRWWTRAMLVGGVALALLLTACGSDGDDATATVAPSDSGSTTGPLAKAGFPDTCPSTGDAFDSANAATYQIFGEAQFQAADGSPAVAHLFIGTAWAVRDRLLATNAHVARVFEDTAAQGVQFSDVLGVQSGTGKVIRLARSLVHPDYTGDPLTSPDVALFTSIDAMPTALPLAPANSVLSIGDDVQIVGFPGDVDEFITTEPGVTVPQATSLLGSVTSRRSHNNTEAVTASNLDVYQHQAPTTPGTSGSSMMHCGLVAAINNAGTVRIVLVPSATNPGEFEFDRQAQAANNFGVHVRHIHTLLSLFDSNTLQGVELPVPAAAAPPGGGGGDGQASIAGTYGAVVNDPQAAHEFQFVIDAAGGITGTSLWPETGEFTLTGAVNADGTFQITDNAPERLGFRRGVYQGVLGADGSIQGVYFEQTVENVTYNFAGGRF